MATKQSSVSQRHVAHFRLRTFGARLDCFASLAMTVGRTACMPHPASFFELRRTQLDRFASQ
jgi:hypothetical protein